MASTYDATPLEHPRCQLGEGPVWDPDSGALYWVDIFGRRVFRLGRDGALEQWETPTRVGALALRAPDGLILGLASGIHALDVDSGALTLLSHPEAAFPDNRYNDCTVGPAGDLWIGSLDDTGVAGNGSLYRVDHDGGWETKVRRVGLSNGLGFAPDGRTLYFTDSTARAIYAYDHDPESGRLGHQRLFAHDVALGPDGLAVDAEGGVWSAKWGAGRIVRYRPDGSVARTIELPVTNVTSLAFGGDALDRLYITTASIALDDPDELRRGAGQVFVHEDPGVAGCPARRCRLDPPAAPPGAEIGAQDAVR